MEAELAGLPADVRQAACEAAAVEGKSGWKFTRQSRPSYGPVTQFADSRRLRAVSVLRLSDPGLRARAGKSRQHPADPPHPGTTR